MSKSLGNSLLVPEVLSSGSGRSSCATTWSPRTTAAHRVLRGRAHRSGVGLPADRGLRRRGRSSCRSASTAAPRVACRLRGGDGRRPRRARGASPSSTTRVREGNAALAECRCTRRMPSHALADVRAMIGVLGLDPLDPSVGERRRRTSFDGGRRASSRSRSSSARRPANARTTRRQTPSATASRQSGVVIEDTAPAPAGRSGKLRDGRNRSDGGRDGQKARKKGASAGSGGQRGKALRARVRRPRRRSATSTRHARQKATSRRRRRLGDTPGTGERGRRAGAAARARVRRRPQQRPRGAARAVSPLTRCSSPSGSTATTACARPSSSCPAGSIPLLEAPRLEIDRLSAGAVHQGLALQVPPYEYAHPDDLLAAGRATPAGAAARGARRRHRPAQPRRRRPFRRRVRWPRRPGPRATLGGHDRRRWKASAGAAARIPVARATNLTRALRPTGRRAASWSVWPPTATTTWPISRSPTTPWCSSSARRARACRGSSAETCDVLVRIPMHSETESLNAGVAAHRPARPPRGAHRSPRCASRQVHGQEDGSHSRDTLRVREPLVGQAEP